jgi:hypothetical protein
MNVMHFKAFGNNPGVRFGNQSQAKSQPTAEQIQIWTDQVMNSPKIDGYIKTTLSMYPNPFPVPMLARLQSANSSEEMRQQEAVLKEAGLIKTSRIGTILALQAPTLESLAKLTEIPFILRTEASR